MEAYAAAKNLAIKAYTGLLARYPDFEAVRHLTHRIVEEEFKEEDLFALLENSGEREDKLVHVRSILPIWSGRVEILARFMKEKGMEVPSKVNHCFRKGWQLSAETATGETFCSILKRSIQRQARCEPKI